MTKQTINIGTSPNDGHGDALRPSFTKVNENFTEVYNTSQAAFNKANTGTHSSNTLINGAHTVKLNDSGLLEVADGYGFIGTYGGPGAELISDPTGLFNGNIGYYSAIETLSANNQSSAGAYLVTLDVGSNNNVVLVGTYNDASTTSNQWVFDTIGDLNLPVSGGIVFDRNNTSIRVGMGFHIASGEGINLQSIDQNNGNAANNWYFSPTGEMYLPLPGTITNNANTWTFGSDGITTFPGETGHQTTFGSVGPVGDNVLASVNDLVLKSKKSVTISSGEGIGALETSYTNSLVPLNNALTAGNWNGVGYPASYMSYAALVAEHSSNPLILDNWLVLANEVLIAYNAWQAALNASAVTIGVGNYGWYFGSDGITTLPGSIIGRTIPAMWNETTPFELDVTATINKIAPQTSNGPSQYHLANGVEGQIMYLVPANAMASNEYTSLGFDNARYSSGNGTITEAVQGWWLPFQSYNNTPGPAVLTLIFTDGAWNLPHNTFD